MLMQIPVFTPPPPPPPIMPSPTVHIGVLYFTLINDTNDVWAFDYLTTQTSKWRLPLFDVCSPSNTSIAVPLDYLTVLKLGLCTPDELGLSEASVAYLKLSNML